MIVETLIISIVSSIIITSVIIGSYIFSKEIWLSEISGDKIKPKITPTMIAWTTAIIIGVIGGY